MKYFVAITLAFASVVTGAAPAFAGSQVEAFALAPTRPLPAGRALGEQRTRDNYADRKVGWGEIQIMPVWWSPLVAAAAGGKLPSQYVGELEKLVQEGRVTRATCSHVALLFSNMPGAVDPGPYPVTGRHGQLRLSVPLRTYPVLKDKEGHPWGFPATLIPFELSYERGESRAVRFHFPAEMIAGSRNPVVEIFIFHGTRQIPLMYLPKGVEGELVSTPMNPQRGTENSLWAAVRNGSRLFMPVIPRDECRGPAKGAVVGSIEDLIKREVFTKGGPN